MVPRPDWRRAFLNLPPDSEPQEYAYIPEDLLPLLPSLRADTPRPWAARPRPMNPRSHSWPMMHILDHACTLLAALRLKLDAEAWQTLNRWVGSHWKL